MSATNVFKRVLKLLAFTLASLFIFLIYNERRKAGNLELEERLLLAELGCGRHNSSVGLRSVRLDLMNNVMSTEAVSAKYRNCDDRLRDEIKSRRDGSPTNLAFSIIMHRDVAILEHQLKILFRQSMRVIYKNFASVGSVGKFENLMDKQFITRVK